jgi:preprotein translocase subunit YajC
MDTGTIIVTIMLLAILVLPFYAAQRSKRKQSK